MNRAIENLDPVDAELLAIVEKDARASFAQMAAQVGLSAPTVAERIRRLEARGVILGYRALVNPAPLGLSVTASIRVRVGGADCAKFAAKVDHWPEIVRIDRLTGEDSHQLLALLKDVKHLERLIDTLTFHGATATAVVLDTPKHEGSVLQAAQHAAAAQRATLRRR